jgi:hypothetical protein
VQARFWLLSLAAVVQFSPGCRPAAAAEKFPEFGELLQYGQYRGTKGWVAARSSAQQPSSQQQKALQLEVPASMQQDY